MISIILPFFNSEEYLKESIQSVLNQNFHDWELILVNDGSTDNSKDIARSYRDSRIYYFEQENKGVSEARNLGLRNMKGDYFCFLDSDDVLPPKSLKSRLSIFELNPNIHFVDGRVIKMDKTLNITTQEWQPTHEGNPLKDLVSLNGNCFLGLTWMIKRISGKNYQFDTNLTHSEDLLFYMKLARNGGEYSFTDDPILYYRDTPHSAMKNLKGLEHGYRFTGNSIKEWNEVDKKLLKTYQFRYKKAMFLAYLRVFQPINAILTIF
ncbi:hypothetical protein GCM10011506_30350 [Marivirga lumbricoides]|uniref:Glycosyltransferase 2-like domain-containing protein n=1 Tax=Marivirga lumbricoides TaxID=1046115 RepID=A0ABQ1MLM0_9BACT|nr:hypothetical protein GCM10011506_30350 [Marivirga lumbricoides]